MRDSARRAVVRPKPGTNSIEQFDEPFDGDSRVSDE
jgi:hypothetical protein